ncbi:RlpA-like double-psi beta-barrel-protein domain-containing protein-containing protein [Mycena albidolilacea]|uniref:RlpA-like double-psi beta-barrel-protein domain-containing protein-containing protein n=1 Tax=Mycena albidolilacea TaxID=1033008 RepID=A0AAD7A0V9_9AGAR|nr:RlpA-like double-psi beta-barrel-protein domain-containing protein-containing protein [Mycena albidolilacea]
MVPIILAASYYDPAGGFGACGWRIYDTDFIVALGEDTWDGGVHCGKIIHVTYNGVTISATVADRCPGCNSLHGPHSIDLSEGAMAALDSNYVNDGIITVHWEGYF